MDFDIDDEILNQFLDDFDEQPKKECKSEPQEVKKSPEPEHLQVLSKFFGHQTFRPLQWEIISSIMYNRRDVCAVMSTGYGKSLCFQFPSTFLGGITLVISPLIALMEDQVLSLKVANIPACLLGTAQKDQAQVIADIFRDKYSLVYLTPEFCAGNTGADILRKMADKMRVTLIAVDEAHCISSWGQDFRYDYRQLGVLREIFTDVPIIAVTATATAKVRNDIVVNLKLRDPLFACTGVDRPNIYLEVNLKSPGGVYNDLSKLMVHDKAGLRFSGPTIVYCITRKETEAISDILTRYGIKSRPYHAGLSLKKREENHELFVKDKIDVIVATIAFGMGIDKPDIRNVIHYGCSKSVENYYQEVGRSGRDGQSAQCVTFYSNRDFSVLRFLNTNQHNNDSLDKMEQYLITSKCRRKFILDHFDEKSDHLDKPRRSCCDICTKKLCDTRTTHQKYEGIDENGCYDFTDDANKLLSAVAAFNSPKFGIGTFIKFLRGSSSVVESKRTHPLFGKGKPQSEAWWQTIARILIQEEYLQEKNERTHKGFRYSAVSLSRKGFDMINSNERLIIPPPSTFLKLLKTKQPQTPSGTQGWIGTSNPVNQPSTSKKNDAVTVAENESDTHEAMALYRRLMDKRGELASKFDCMPYMVASNAALMILAKSKPTTLHALKQLQGDGFTEAKINKFGNQFLEVITRISGQVPSNKKRSIRDILQQHPLPDVSASLTADVSCSMLNSGLTIGEISEKRGVVKSTVMSHLITGLKFGHTVKLEELGITHEIRDSVIKVYREFFKTDFHSIKLSLMKERCPPETSFDEIKAVLAYLQVRCYLENLNIPYEEFEDYDFSDTACNETEPDSSSVQGNIKEVFQKIKNAVVGVADSAGQEMLHEVKELSDDASQEVLKKIKTDVTEEASLKQTGEAFESPAKKFKTSKDADFDAILDSPPRPNLVLEAERPKTPVKVEEPDTSSAANVNSGTKKSNNRNAKKVRLPPWLVVKKI